MLAEEQVRQFSLQAAEAVAKRVATTSISLHEPVKIPSIWNSKNYIWHTHFNTHHSLYYTHTHYTHYTHTHYIHVHALYAYVNLSNKSPPLLSLYTIMNHQIESVMDKEPTLPPLDIKVSQS